MPSRSASRRRPSAPVSRPLLLRLLGGAFYLLFALALTAALLFALYSCVVAPARENSSPLAERTEAVPSEGLKGLAVQLLLATKEEELVPVSDDPDAPPVAFEVHPGESASDVAIRLQNVGLIRDASAFKLLLQHHGLDRHIEAGRFQLSPAMSSREIATALLSAQGHDTVLVTLEGWRLEQVAAAVQEAFGAGDEFLSLATSRAADFVPFWVGRPPEVASVEGMLFPDTYRLSPDATPETILSTMVGNFEQRFGPEHRARAAEMGLTPYQVLIIASIVEREAVVPEERPLIAGVFLNRLEADMLLEADPTVQYALGWQEDTRRWWKVPLLLADLRSTHSPYNTYLSPGLPPGPICSPSLASIEAVLWPAETDYLYFVARGDGSHVFSLTFDEHLANVARYQGG
ncbi:MAG: endolytic transglycosylase MltG [Anaerolineae bacterium]|nr:endolytic transglycosylase MltG [Anaerolineae bacterium]